MATGSVHQRTKWKVLASLSQSARLPAVAFIALAALLLPGSRAQAQEHIRPCPFEIDAAIVLHDEQMNELVSSRFHDLEEGDKKREIRRKLDSQLQIEERAFERSRQAGPSSAIREVDAVAQENMRAFKRLVAGYLEYAQNGQPRGSNAIIAYIPDGETICAIFAEHRPDWSEPRAFMFQLPLSLSRLQALIEARMAELTGDAARLERSPVRRHPARQVTGPGEIGEASRAAVPRGQARSGTRPPDRILADIATALFPDTALHHIEGEIDNLTVVPSLNIGTVPFSALDIDGDGSPLVVSMSINVEATLHDVLAGDIYGWDGVVRNPVVLGDPDATADPDWVLPRLPGARLEAETIASLFRSEPILAKQATEPRLLEEILDADYIHIAAHGIADPENPIDGSFLALTGDRLTAREIQSLDFGRNLPVVVLSACQSALGGTLEAGIIGVARGFLYAGAINVIASLWNVDDAATSEIMTRFAQELKVSNPLDALRTAQLEARERWPDPRIWAAFIVFGKRLTDMQ